MFEKEELESLQRYLGLDSKEDAIKMSLIMNELENEGEWGKKVLSYLTSILSGIDGSRSFISEDNIIMFKSLFNI